MSANAARFLDENPLKNLLNIPQEALDFVMAKAYQLYQVGRYAEVEVLCKGLIAADHKYWWSYSLYAAALHRLGREREALVQVDLGLVYEPEQARLLLLRGEILAALGRIAEAGANLAPVTVTGRPSERVSAMNTLTRLSAA